MSASVEREAVIVIGTLGDGSRLEWLAEDGAVIYVGSDPRCRWRLAAPGVAPFHWQLCWFGGRLWMAELEPRMAREAGWMAAPVGVVMRLGGSAMVLGVSSSARTSVSLRAVSATPAPAAPSVRAPVVAKGAVRGAVHRALIPRAARASQPVNTASGVVDPDATQLVEPDQLRALPVFGPPGRAMPAMPVSPFADPGAAPPAARVAPAGRGGVALEEMFIVPAEVAVAAPRPPGPLARLAVVVPLRPLLALLIAGGAALLVFLPESLHANRNQRPAATLPARRPPPEADIEMRGVPPEPARSASENVAARDLASGRLEEALDDYRALQTEVPDQPVFRDFAAVIERRIKARCVNGNCAEGSEKAAAAARAAEAGNVLMKPEEAARAVEAIR
ncbi:MAG TPA: hypothetical protein VK698_14235 [Kofleriaceae bacterium]|nr:hypothetical protein [Kofleriaceae bacterium]